MRTIELKVYSINELPEKMQQKAFDKWLEHAEYGWSSDNEAVMIAFEKIFPIKVIDWSYDSYNGSVSFEMTTEYEDIDNMTGVRLMAYLWNNYKNDIFKGKYYSLWSKTEKSYKFHKDGFPVLKSRHSKIMLVSECPLTGYCVDYNILEPIINFLNKPDNSTFKELMEQCLNAWIKACVNDAEYSTSFEYFKEECEGNGYEFDEKGNRI